MIGLPTLVSSPYRSPHAQLTNVSDTTPGLIHDPETKPRSSAVSSGS